MNNKFFSAKYSYARLQAFLPKYEYVETHDVDGNPIWNVECNVDEMDTSFNAEGSSKKQAKKEAALKMLQYALDNYDEE